MRSISRQTIARWAVSVLAVLLVAYPFSIGPVFYLAGEAGLDNNPTACRLLNTVYEPCGFLKQNSELYERYVDWWFWRMFVRNALKEPPPPQNPKWNVKK